jgi:hypothetical protein
LGFVRKERLASTSLFPTPGHSPMKKLLLLIALAGLVITLLK